MRLSTTLSDLSVAATASAPCLISSAAASSPATLSATCTAGRPQRAARGPRRGCGAAPGPTCSSEMMVASALGRRKLLKYPLLTITTSLALPIPSTGALRRTCAGRGVGRRSAQPRRRGARFGAAAGADETRPGACQRLRRLPSSLPSSQRCICARRMPPISDRLRDRGRAIGSANPKSMQDDRDRDMFQSTGNSIPLREPASRPPRDQVPQGPPSQALLRPILRVAVIALIRGGCQTGIHGALGR